MQQILDKCLEEKPKRLLMLNFHIVFEFVHNMHDL
jgi:hypothetical protein